VRFTRTCTYLLVSLSLKNVIPIPFPKRGRAQPRRVTLKPSPARAHHPARRLPRVGDTQSAANRDESFINNVHHRSRATHASSRPSNHPRATLCVTTLDAHVVHPLVHPSTCPHAADAIEPPNEYDEAHKTTKNISTHRQALVPEPGDEERFLRRRERLQLFQVAILLLLGGCVDDLQRTAGRRRRALLVRARADGFRRDRVSLRERVHRGTCVRVRAT